MLKVLGVVIPIDPVINNIGASQQRQDGTLGEDYCQLVSPMNNSDLISFSYFDPDEHPSLASPIYRNLPPIVGVPQDPPPEQKQHQLHYFLL